MLNKVTLLLSMTLNLVLALIVYQNNKPVKLADFRDALSDTRVSGQQLSNSLASVTPTLVPPAEAVSGVSEPVMSAPIPAIPGPVQITTTVSEIAPEAAVAPVAPVAPVAATAPVKTAALLITGGNDWAAYKQDAAEDTDVFVSNIFRSRTNGEKAAAAAVRRHKAAGREILFSCVLTEKSGGVFYVIRMSPPVIQPPQVASAISRKSNDSYSSDLGEITSRAESELQVMY